MQKKKNKKPAFLGTSHILQKVLLYKYKIYFTCEITLHVAQTVNTEQLQPYVHYLYSLFQVYNFKYPA